MSREIPKGMTFWKQDSDELDPAEIVRRYGSGMAGVWQDDEAKAELLGSVQWPDGEQAAHTFGLADSASGQLVPAWLGVERCFPGCWPGSAQTRGDCVSHSTRNAGLTAVCGDILSGKPDEASGKMEAQPEDLSPTGARDGVFSTELIYWYRRHGGDGWSCGAASSVIKGESGLWVRKNYQDLGFDLSKYSGSTAGKYGRSTPPENITTIGRQHLIRTVTELSSFEQVRDFLANGYGISTCGGEGWSSTRDENGFSPRRGSWAHALAFIGADDRDVIKQKYGEPLVLILNSWGNWNSGGTKVLGTEWNIPSGSYWAKWSDAKRRDMYAYSGVNGWPKRKIDFWGTSPKWG